MPLGCNYGPYSYQWSYSDNGFSWHNIPSSNTPSVPTLVTPSSNAIPLSFQTRLYRVKVTTATGFSVYGIGQAVYSCMASVTEMSAKGTILTGNSTAPALQVYPNPSSGTFRLSAYVPEEDLVNIGVYDMLSKRVQHIYRGILKKGYYEFPVTIALTPGHYRLVLKGKTIKATEKLIID